MSTKRGTIQIGFIDHAGKADGNTQLSGPRVRKLDHSRWDKLETIKRFQWYLARQDDNGLSAATDALIRQNNLGEALGLSKKGVRPNTEKVKSLLSLWNSHGLHAIPRSLKERLYLYTDLIKYFVLPYQGPTITLYRGQSKLRHEQNVYGIAWTSRREIAEKFSCLRNSEGVVLKVDASPAMVVAHLPKYISTPKTDVRNAYEFEDEYLLDPRLLVGQVSVV